MVFLISNGLLALAFFRSYLQDSHLTYETIKLFLWILITQCAFVFVLLSIFIFNRLLKPLDTLSEGVVKLNEGNIVYFPEFKDMSHNYIANYITKISIKAQHLSLDKEAIQSDSEKDFLTGLANRRTMETFLQQQFGHAQRYSHELHVLMIDIDKFKLLNDNYGHQVGDLCLQELSRLLSYNTRRTNELAARYGGEEFILIISGMPTPEVVEWAESIRMQVESLKVYLSKEYTEYVNFTLSIGICSLIAHHVKAPEQMVAFADEALYEAKSMGRNQVRIYRS